MDWQALVSFAVHATQAPTLVSQTWCIGSHARQSAFVEQLICGVPWLSVGHSRPSGTQLPQLEQYSPSGHPDPVSALHATQRRSSTKQVLRPSEQPPQWSSSRQLWSRQIELSDSVSEPSSGPPVVIGSLFAHPKAITGAARRRAASRWSIALR